MKDGQRGDKSIDGGAKEDLILPSIFSHWFIGIAKEMVRALQRNIISISMAFRILVEININGAIEMMPFSL